MRPEDLQLPPDNHITDHMLDAMGYVIEIESAKIKEQIQIFIKMGYTIDELVLLKYPHKPELDCVVPIKVTWL